MASPPDESEVAVASVDEGLLELLPNKSWNLLDAMMGRRGYRVQTATVQMEAVGKYHYGLKALPQGGGGKHPTRELFDTLLVWQGRVPLAVDPSLRMLAAQSTGKKLRIFQRELRRAVVAHELGRYQRRPAHTAALRATAMAEGPATTVQRHAGRRLDWTSLADISLALQNAVIASEDQRFTAMTASIARQ